MARDAAAKTFPDLPYNPLTTDVVTRTMATDVVMTARGEKAMRPKSIGDQELALLQYVGSRGRDGGAGGGGLRRAARAGPLDAC